MWLEIVWINENFFYLKISIWNIVIDAKGRKPNPSKSSVIKNMPAKTNVSTLLAFLGLANYYSNFIPNMHVLRAPLNKSLKKDLKWNWSTEIQSVF